MKFEEEKGGTFIGIEVGVIVIAILQIAILSHFGESCYKTLTNYDEFRHYKVYRKS